MPEVVLLDTSIVSVFLKVSKVHETRRKQIEESVLGKIAVISFVTVAELFYWAESKSWGEKKRAELDQRLAAYGVLDPTRATAETWASTKQKCGAAGVTVGAHDLWIAAAAFEHAIPVVSADTDFDRIPGLTVVKL